jgi:hypothetical protein
LNQRTVVCSVVGKVDRILISPRVEAACSGDLEEAQITLVQLRDTNLIKSGKPLRIIRDFVDDHFRAAQQVE